MEQQVLSDNRVVYWRDIGVRNTEFARVMEAVVTEVIKEVIKVVTKEVTVDTLEATEVCLL